MQWLLRFVCSRSPPFTDRSLRVRRGSYYFVLRERPFRPGCFGRAGGSIPGDVLAGLLISVAAYVPRCRTSDSSRAHVSSSFFGLALGCGALCVSSSFVCAGRSLGPLTPCKPRPGFCSPSVHDAVRAGGCRPRHALCSPLRIPKRARASLFSKLQRANGECLGV